MSLKEDDVLLDQVCDTHYSKFHDNFNELYDINDEDDLMLSQAYDLLINQSTTSTNNVEDECLKSLEKGFDKPHTVEDNELVSAYDLIFTQSTITANVEVIQCPEKDREEIYETSKHMKVSVKVHEAEGEGNEKTYQMSGGNFLEDPVLRETIFPCAATGIQNLLENESLDNDKLDLSEASTVATITLMNIFDRSWKKIASKQDSLNTSTSILIEILGRAFKIIKPRSRWRQPDPSSWKRNIVKKRRADGLPYVTAKKIRQGKIPRTADCSTCKFSCTAKISIDDRDRLCRKYWSLDYAAKKNFILNLVQVKPIKTTVIVRKRATQRSNTKQYFFKINSLELQVCQSFFYKTLCISPSVISNAVANRDSMGLYSGTKDPRGRHEPKNKTPFEQLQGVHDHINSFPTMESHYVRKSITRKYLDSSLSVYKMYKLYEEECEKNGTLPVSEATYRKIFSTHYNLGFFVPKKDQCLVCTKYDRLNSEEKSGMEQEFQEHIKRKNACNEEKKRDKERAKKEANFLSASFDLQAILQIPSGDVGLLYYCRKLIVYNLTIYESAAPNDAYCFSWNEINGKKGSSEIGSIILHYLSEIPDRYNEVALFSDTCGGQNRNQHVAAVLLWAVHKIKHINIIEHKFLESGHSYMEVDSMHSCIETAKKHTNVYSMTEWLNIFRRARTSRKSRVASKKPYTVKEMKYTDFKDLKMLSKTLLKTKSKTSEGQRVKWLKIKRMKYVKGESRIYYNYDMSENFYYIDLDIHETPYSDTLDDENKNKHRYHTRNSKKSINVIDSPQSYPQKTVSSYFPTQLNNLYTEPLPISAAKKADLLKLCQKDVIPEEYHGWFQNLKTDCHSVDRVPDLTVSDESDEFMED